MAERKFFQMLQDNWQCKSRRVCVGLDTDHKRLPDRLRHPTGYGMVDIFNLEVIKATADLALAYKINIAFYSGRYMPDSLQVLARTIDYVRRYAPETPVILDAKRADIGTTNNGYIEEAFEAYQADAVTVNPYFGMEAMQPFLDQEDKGIIVLCKTSNKGGGEFQDLIVEMSEQSLNEIAQTLPGNHDGMMIPKKMPLYQYVAWRTRIWNRKHKNCALVVGATYPEQLGKVRRIVGDMWLLVPGVGTQGGSAEAVVKNGLNAKSSGVIINSSSGILFASSGPDYVQAARRETLKLGNQINAALGALTIEHT